MDLLKCQITTLELICESFYKKLHKTNLFKYISLPMSTKLNHCHICKFTIWNTFFICNCVFHWVSNWITVANNIRESLALFFADLPPHSYYQLTDLNPLCTSIVRKQFLFSFSLSERQVCKFFIKIISSWTEKQRVFFYYKLQETLNLDKPLPLTSSVLHQNLDTVQFSDKLEPLIKSPFKIIDEPFTYDFLTQDRKTFHTDRNHSISCFPKEHSLFPNLELYNEQNDVTTHDSDKADMIQEYQGTSYDNSDLGDNAFDDDLLCNDYDNTSIMFDKEEQKRVNSDDDNHHPARSKNDSERPYHKPRSSKFQSFNKFPEIFDLSGPCAVFVSPMSFADKSDSSLYFVQTHASNRNNRNLYDLGQQPWKNTVFSLHQLPLRMNHHFHEA